MPGSDSSPITTNDEQLALFKEHVLLQREELAETANRNRADEQIELRRLTVDADAHEKNLAHAAKVLEAQAQDRHEVRNFWNGQLSKFTWIIGLIIVLTALTAFYGIYSGNSEEVFEMMKLVMTHAIALLAGVGVDRAWIHRKKTGISNSDSEGA